MRDPTASEVICSVMLSAPSRTASVMPHLVAFVHEDCINIAFYDRGRLVLSTHQDIADPEEQVDTLVADTVEAFLGAYDGMAFRLIRMPIPLYRASAELKDSRTFVRHVDTDRPKE